MRLLFVGASGHVHFRRWVEAMARLGHEAVAIHTGNDAPSKIAGARVLPLRTRIYRTALQVAEVRVVHRIFRPHVVHVHWLPNAHLPLLAQLRPLVVTAWGSDVLRPETFSAEVNATIGAAIKRADLVTCDSKSMKEAILDRGGDAAPIKVVQWGVDTTLFYPKADTSEVRAALSLGDGPVIFNPRQLDPVYNPETVLAAIPAVIAAVPDAKFIFKHYIQDADRVAEVRGIARELGLLNAVRFLEPVPYELMPALYAVADITVSVASSDGTPMSLLEAMACGSVPIVSDLPSLREWIVDGVNGRVVAPRDKDALAKAIVELIKDRELRRRSRESNWRLIEERGRQDNEMRKMDALYRDLLANSRA